MSATPHTDFRSLFARQVSLKDDEVDLPLAALYLAGEEYGDLDVDLYLNRLDDLAHEVEALSGSSTDREALARCLNQCLFDQKGFSGNTTDYYNPENSFLNRVMDTGIGIPIALSVLYLGVARRLGLDCNGVGMPGHFLVRIQDLDLYMDPFHAGQLLSAGDCRRLYQQMFGPGSEWEERFLEPTSNKMILLRMLNNLRVIYSQDRDSARLAPVLERMLLLDDASVVLYRELAVCQINLGRKHSAVDTLHRLISHSSNSQEIAAAQNLIRDLIGDQ